jgi:hypothetical protein
MHVFIFGSASFASSENVARGPTGADSTGYRRKFGWHPSRAHLAYPLATVESVLNTVSWLLMRWCQFLALKAFVRRLRIGAKDDDRLSQQSTMSGAAQLLAPWGRRHAVVGLRELILVPAKHRLGSMTANFLA